MAIVVLGPMITDARNKVGGIVYTRTRGGATVRAWVKPSNPQSNLQQYFRGLEKAIGKAWPGTLTQAQRNDWNERGAGMIGRNNVGALYPRAGQDVYQERNMLSAIAGGTLIADAPADVMPVGPGQLTFSASSGAQTLTLTPTNSLPGGYGIILRATKPLSPGIFNFAKWLRSLISPPGIIASGFGSGTAPVPPFTAGYGYVAADWAVSAGTLTVTPSVSHEDIYNPTILTDSIVNCTITLPDLTQDYIPISARLNVTTGEAYIIQLYPPGNFWGIWYRPLWPESSIVNLAFNHYTAWTTTPTTLQFSLAGTTLSATYAGTSTMSVTDTRLTSGACGLIAYAPTESFQSWSLTKPTATLPTIGGLTATYLAKYGALVSGKKIGIELSYVNLTTGQEIPPSSALATIS
jgi:hypothetical protein